jgi:hypothetical protein
MLPCQIQFARLSRVIDRCNAAIALEQKRTTAIMREEHAAFLHRQAQRRSKAKAKTPATS